MGYAKKKLKNWDKQAAELGIRQCLNNQGKYKPKKRMNGE